MAPALDFIAPDLYARGFKLVARDFTQSGNPLFIPETNGGNIAGPQAVYAFAEHDAMCFSPFAIENYQPNTPTTIIYDALNNMMPLIARYQGTGKMAGFYQLNTSETRERIELGNYRLNITYGGNTGGRGGRGGMGGFGGNTGGPGAGVAQALGAGAAPGAAAVPGAGRGAGGAAVTSGTAAGGRGGRGARGAGGFGGGNQDIACFGLAIAMGPDDFLLFGSGYSVQFEALNPPSDKPNVDLASVDEGKVVDGQWVRGRRLNGDEHQRGINIRRMVSPSAAADMAATAGPGMGMGMRGFAPTTTPSFLRVRVYNRK